MKEIIQIINSYLWGWPMVILLLGTHIFFTIRLKFPQRKIFKAIRMSVSKDNGAAGDISQFGALATSLAATIGTGNIIGVAIAISAGGPGAVFWCWLTGVFGIATKYSEGLLAVFFRKKNSEGQMIGGPMCALEKGLGMRWLAILFCIFTAIASFGIGASVQSNAIASVFNESWHFPPVYTGIIVTIMAAIVIIFGVKGIAQVCSKLVPLMALFYVICCIIILIINFNFLGQALSLILKSAFTSHAATGGFIGSTIMMAARFGIARGLFSNESGLGSAPIVAAAAQTKDPVRQAMISSTATFWDTVVICAITGLVLVSSIIAYPEIDSTKTAMLTQQAFSHVPFGDWILSIGIATFAFSTILGWSYYGQKATEYIGGVKWAKIYKILFVITVFLGSIYELGVVWDFADLFNALMAIPNIISLLLLSSLIVRVTNKYNK